MSEMGNPKKLWLLRRQRPYDKYFGFLIRAATEEEARKIASQAARSDGGATGPAWLDPKMSTCVELTGDGPTEIIIDDFWRS